MKQGLEHLIDNSFTLYRCTPLQQFASRRWPYAKLEQILAEKLCAALDLCIIRPSDNNTQSNENSEQEESPQLNTTKKKNKAKGQLYRIKFRPFELTGYEYDQTNNIQPPLRFELEYQYYDTLKKGGENSISLIMLPAKKNPSTASKEYWYYPIILARINKKVFNVLYEVFDEMYHARITPFHMSQSVMQHMLVIYAETFTDQPPPTNEFVGHISREDYRSTNLRLHYVIDNSANIKTIKFEIRADQCRKMHTLNGGDPTIFLECFEHHIQKKTSIILSKLRIESIACSIVSISLYDKLKIHPRASQSDAFKIINALADFAYR